jgi:hypothetical protein
MLTGKSQVISKEVRTISATYHPAEKSLGSALQCGQSARIPKLETPHEEPMD